VKDRVEAEVAKRMEILEKQRLEEERMAREADKTSTPDASVAVNDSTLSSSLLAPLLKRHQDLDTELRSRLEELEMK
jgi:kinesin family member 22